MKLSLLDQIIVGVYLAVIMTIGFAMKRRAARGMSAYFLGGRRLPCWALAMSGSSSYFDITGTMWIVSIFIMLGLKGMWVHWLWGFPITAFYLAYMGKWIRRSGVLTGAEWMTTRFGSGPAGDLARLAYTLFAILTISALLGYGAIGMGKFGAVFLPFPPFTCAVLILGVTGLYVVVGGFHGIVRVEILQTLVLSAGAITFAVIGYRHFDAAAFAARVPQDWFSILPSNRPPEFRGLVSGGTDFSWFGALVAVWLAKGLLLCFSGPEQLYDFQRVLAARDARDASKLGALWADPHRALAVRDGHRGDCHYGRQQSGARPDAEGGSGNRIAADHRRATAGRAGRLHARGVVVGFSRHVQFHREWRRGVSGPGHLPALSPPHRRHADTGAGQLCRVGVVDPARPGHRARRDLDQYGVHVDFWNARRRDSAGQRAALVLVASERLGLRRGGPRRHAAVAGPGDRG
jgi:hypothetical protein